MLVTCFQDNSGCNSWLPSNRPWRFAAHFAQSTLLGHGHVCHAAFSDGIIYKGWFRHPRLGGNVHENFYLFFQRTHRPMESWLQRWRQWCPASFDSVHLPFAVTGGLILLWSCKKSLISVTERTTMPIGFSLGGAGRVYACISPRSLLMLAASTATVGRG